MYYTRIYLKKGGGGGIFTWSSHKDPGPKVGVTFWLDITLVQVRFSFNVYIFLWLAYLKFRHVDNEKKRTDRASLLDTIIDYNFPGCVA